MKKKMNTKSFLKDSKIGFILLNLLAAVIVGLLIVVFVVMRLRSYTQHGIEVDVPNVVGLYEPEARAILESAHLKLTVIDSTYSQKVPLGSIVDQNPVANSHAKQDREVYVVVNATCRRRIPLPELHDVSLRQAEVTLKSLGITVEEIVYEPSEFKDLVMDVTQHGESLPAGAQITEGSRVTLHVGQGKGTEMVYVPNLQGLSPSNARSLLIASHLSMGLAEYDVEPTDENKDTYVIYAQHPAAGTLLLEGSRVDIKFSTNIEKAVTTGVESDDDFF